LQFLRVGREGGLHGWQGLAMAVQTAAGAGAEAERDTPMGGTSDDRQGRRDLKAFCVASERRTAPAPHMTHDP
jgi:hypothetical protein